MIIHTVSEEEGRDLVADQTLAKLGFRKFPPPTHPCSGNQGLFKKNEFEPFNFSPLLLKHLY